MRTTKRETRNQRRKKEYKALAESAKGDGSRRAAKRAALKSKRTVRLVGTRGPHRRPCGNVACRECYVRAEVA